MSKYRVIQMFLFISCFQAYASFASEIPNMSLMVAANQKIGGKLSRGLHEFNLVCFNQSCELTVITMNQCSVNPTNGKLDAPIGSERYSTSEGTLNVYGNGPDTVTAEFKPFDLGGESHATLRFKYSKYPSEKMIRRVTEFSGGFTKDSAILDKILAVEYVPMKGAWHSVKLDCRVLLPGVPQ